MDTIESRESIQKTMLPLYLLLKKKHIYFRLIPIRINLCHRYGKISKATFVSIEWKNKYFRKKNCMEIPSSPSRWKFKRISFSRFKMDFILLCERRLLAICYNENLLDNIFFFKRCFNQFSSYRLYISIQQNRGIVTY